MRKSEVAVQSEHVLKFVFDKEAQFIRGIVQASMRDRSYNVTVSSFDIIFNDSLPNNIIYRCNSTYGIYILSLIRVYPYKYLY